MSLYRGYSTQNAEESIQLAGHLNLSATFLASFIKKNDNFLLILIKLILSVSNIYILGVFWLGTLIGWDKPILELGVLPFLLAEFFKVTLLAILTKKIYNFRKFI